MKRVVCPKSNDITPIVEIDNHTSDSMPYTKNKDNNMRGVSIPRMDQNFRGIKRGNEIESNSTYRKKLHFNLWKRGENI